MSWRWRNVVSRVNGWWQRKAVGDALRSKDVKKLLRTLERNHTHSLSMALRSVQALIHSLRISAFLVKIDLKVTVCTKPFVISTFFTWNFLAGELVHSQHYRCPDRFAGKRVLIIGAGESGSDITNEISKVASKCAIAVRGLHGHLIPRIQGDHIGEWYILFCPHKHVDMSKNQSFAYLYLKIFQPHIVNLLIELSNLQCQTGNGRVTDLNTNRVRYSNPYIFGDYIGYCNQKAKRWPPKPLPSFLQTFHGSPLPLPTWLTPTTQTHCTGLTQIRRINGPQEWDV